jgi:hypothetical protein
MTGVDTGVAAFPRGVEDARGLMGNGESRSLAGIAVTVVVARVPDGEGRIPGGWDPDRDSN